MCYRKRIILPYVNLPIGNLIYADVSKNGLIFLTKFKIVCFLNPNRFKYPYEHITFVSKNTV